MPLANAYVQPVKKIPDLFAKIRDGQAPERFTQLLLRDWGFSTKNDRAFIPLLKQLGFLTAEGKPTQRYNDYRDHSRSKTVLAQALREAYGDIFLIKEHPTNADRVAIEGKRSVRRRSYKGHPPSGYAQPQAALTLVQVSS